VRPLDFGLMSRRPPDRKILPGALKNRCRPPMVLVSQMCRRSAAQLFFPLHPGLTPRANFMAAAGAAGLMQILSDGSTA